MSGSPPRVRVTADASAIAALPHTPRRPSRVTKPRNGARQSDDFLMTPSGHPRRTPANKRSHDFGVSRRSDIADKRL